MRFGENNVLGPKYIDIIIWISGVWGGRTYSTVNVLFIIQKIGKSTRAWPILKWNSTSFWFIFFPRMYNNKITKRCPKGDQLLFLYELSIVVLIDFIAILLTPGIFLIQIIDRNMYLTDFYIKNNIKMHFSKVEFFKFQNRFRRSLSIATRWNKLRWHQ